MKRIALIVVMLFVATSTVYAAGVGEYSMGYRMGQLSKFSIKGYVQKSGEGQMLMGKDSNPYSHKVGDKTVRVNPWYFSSESALCPELEKAAGEYIVVEYTQARVANPLAQDTEYTANKVYPVTRKAVEPKEFGVPKPSTLKSDGVRVGRVVKVAHKGTINKTYEVLIQMGDSGNQFKNMSVTSQEMFDYLVKVLKSGKSVKIHYVEHMVQPFYDTPYEIYKVSTPEDL